MKRPNKNGLYDMHKCLEEWCEDWYADDLGKDDAKRPKMHLKAKGSFARSGGYVFSARTAEFGKSIFQYECFQVLFLDSGW